MAIKIIKGSDKEIVVRLTSEATKDPVDLNDVSMIKACFPGEVDEVEEFYLALSGDIVSGSPQVQNIDVTNILEGMPVVGDGIQPGTVVLATPLSLAPTPANTITLSKNVTGDGRQKAMSLGSIRILAALIGKFVIGISSKDSKLLDSGEDQGFEVTVVKGGRQSKVQFEESLEIVEGRC